MVGGVVRWWGDGEEGKIFEPRMDTDGHGWGKSDYVADMGEGVTLDNWCFCQGETDYDYDYDYEGECVSDE